MIEPRAVNSRAELAAFVKALSVDFEENAEAWGNVTIGTFLEAMSAWLDAAPGWARNMTTYRPDLWMDVEAPSWQFFAAALRVARTYE